MIKIGRKSRGKDTARIKVQIRPSQTDQHYRAVFVTFEAWVHFICCQHIDSVLAPNWKNTNFQKSNVWMHRYTLVHTLKIPKFLQKRKTLKLRQCFFLLHPQLFFCQTIIFALRKPPRHKWSYPSLFNLDFYAVLCLYERYTQLWWAIVCKWSWFILLHVDLKIAKCQFAKKKGLNQ